MTAAALFTILVLFCAPDAGAQTTPRTPSSSGGFADLSPERQAQILNQVAPFIADICGNFSAVTELNKTFVALTAGNDCATKTTEDRAMFQFVLEDAIARCETHVRGLIQASRAPSLQIRLKPEEMARFASDSLKPILAVNCR